MKMTVNLTFWKNILGFNSFHGLIVIKLGFKLFETSKLIPLTMELRDEPDRLVQTSVWIGTLCQVYVQTNYTLHEDVQAGDYFLKRSDAVRKIGGTFWGFAPPHLSLMPQDSYEYWINEIMWKEKTRFSRMAESVSQRNFQTAVLLMIGSKALDSRVWGSFILKIRSNDSNLVFFSWRFIKSKKRKFKKPCIVYNKQDPSCTQDSDLSVNYLNQSLKVYQVLRIVIYDRERRASNQTRR